jgi:hypothetical protein
LSPPLCIREGIKGWVKKVKGKGVKNQHYVLLFTLFPLPLVDKI